MRQSDARRALLDHVGEETPFLCSLSTVREDGGPAVRFVRAKMDESLVLRIPTFAGTHKVRQIQADPRVHIACGSTDSERPGTYFQIDGLAEISTDATERQACWTERLEKWFSGPSDPNYAVVRVAVRRIEALPIGRSGDARCWEESPSS